MQLENNRSIIKLPRRHYPDHTAAAAAAAAVRYTVNICRQSIGLSSLSRCFVPLTQYYSGDKIEKNEMGGACSMYGGEEKCIPGFGGETRGKETTWETQAKKGV
jgi:hypothetical protein